MVEQPAPDLPALALVVREVGGHVRELAPLLAHIGAERLVFGGLPGGGQPLQLSLFLLQRDLALQRLGGVVPGPGGPVDDAPRRAGDPDPVRRLAAGLRARRGSADFAVSPS